MEGDGELYGKSSEEAISSRRIKLIRPAVVSWAYFKCHRCSLPPILLSKRLPPPKLLVDVSLRQGGPCYTRSATSRKRERVGEANRDCARYEAEVKAEDVMFDVIPGRNPDGAVAAGICQLVRTRVDAKQKLYMTSARLEKGRNTRGVARAGIR